MMRIYRLVGILGLLYLHSYSYGQIDKTLSGDVKTKLLEFGDPVPDLIFYPIVNFKGQSSKISDFSDQLLILDFWATWCVPCIRPFPKLDSLQRKYRGKLQFMLVTDEKKELIERFFQRLKKRKEYALPSVVEDTNLHKYFAVDNAFNRAYVWVMNGKVVAQTSKVTEEEIRLVLAGKSINNEQSAENRAKEKLPYDFSRPLLSTKVLEGTNTIKYYSGFTSYIKGLEPEPYIKTPTPENPNGGIRVVNLPLSWLYLEAYQIFPIRQVSLEIAELERFAPPKGKRDSSNLFCYELIMPDAGLGELREIMKEDLHRVFGYRVTQEVRTVNVAVLKVAKNEKLFTAGGDPYMEKTNFYITIKNKPFSELVGALKYYVKTRELRFFIDETGIKKNIDISLDVNLSDPTAVAKELEQYGLDLTFEKRPMKMYVIKDKE